MSRPGTQQASLSTKLLTTASACVEILSFQQDPLRDCLIANMSAAELAEDLARAMTAHLTLDSPDTPHTDPKWDTIATNSRYVYDQAQRLSPDLIFEHPPQSILQEYRQLEEDILMLDWIKSAPISANPNTGAFALKPTNPSTKKYIAIESMLWTLADSLEKDNSFPPREIRLDIERSAEILDGLKRQAWKAAIQGVGAKMVASSSGIPIFVNSGDGEFKMLSD
jgi:hypothetical protein